MKLTQNDLELKSNQIRKDIIDMIFNAGSGHPAGSLGLVELMVYLYFVQIKNINLILDKSFDRDFVFLSNGHVAPVLYSVLARRGFFNVEILNSLRKFGSILQGHPHFGLVPGIENSGGPLGQGISQAVGLASVLKRENKLNKVYCFVGDGELSEGQCWEAFLYASRENLDNLVIIVDNNNIQIDGPVSRVSNYKNLHRKFSSFGFFVIEFDGNNFSQIATAFNHINLVENKPICFIARTIAGKGISFMENNYLWHGRTLNSEEYNQAILELDLNENFILKRINDEKIIGYKN